MRGQFQVSQVLLPPPSPQKRWAPLFFCLLLIVRERTTGWILAHPFHVVCTLRVYKQPGGFVISKWSFQKGRDFSDLNRSSFSFLVLKEKEKKKEKKKKNIYKIYITRIKLSNATSIPTDLTKEFLFLGPPSPPTPNEMRDSTQTQQTNRLCVVYNHIFTSSNIK